MLIVALTGGIGSGKSTAGSTFENLGALVIDSDQLAREVIERGTPGFDQIIQEFGDGILKNGEIDRSALATIVFKDPALLFKLESITHPLIRKAFQDYVTRAPKDAVVINQIPLLVESDHNYKFDLVITVSAKQELRKERLLARGLSDAEIARRMAAQATDLQREAIADFVINNDGDEASLISEIERIWQKLQIINKAK